MNDVRRQHCGLQRFLAAMALAAILETSGMTLGADDHPVRTKSKTGVFSGAAVGREKTADDFSDAGWHSRGSVGRWTSGARTSEQVSTGEAGISAKPFSSAKSGAVRSSARRSPSLIFIAGKSASEDHKPGPSEDLPNHDTLEAVPKPAPEQVKQAVEPETDDTQEQTSTKAATGDQPTAGDADGMLHDSAEVSHHAEANQAPPDPQAESEEPTYFDAPAETMPGLSPEESLDDQPVMSTTERFKQLLIENERLRNEGATASAGHEDSQHQPATPAQDGGFRSFGTVPSLEEDLKSEDPARRQRAQRILRIREQILHLKSRARKAESTKNSDPGDSRMSAENPEENDQTATPSHSGGPAGISLLPADSDAAEHHPDETHTGDGGNKHDSARHGDDSHSESPAAHDGSSEAHDHHGAKPVDGGDDVQAADPFHEPSSDHPQMAGAEDQASETHESPDLSGHRSGYGSTDAAHGLVTIGDPIDRVGLANNLYALGEYPAAHDAYRSVEPEQLTPEQQFWVEYQIANCLRRLGESAAASNQFRKLAAQPEAGWVSEQAAWWVEILEQIRQAEKDLKDDDPASVPAVPGKKLPLSGISTESSHGSRKH